MIHNPSECVCCRNRMFVAGFLIGWMLYTAAVRYAAWIGWTW